MVRIFCITRECEYRGSKTTYCLSGIETMEVFVFILTTVPTDCMTGIGGKPKNEDTTPIQIITTDAFFVSHSVSNYFSIETEPFLRLIARPIKENITDPDWIIAQNMTNAFHLSFSKGHDIMKIPGQIAT